MKMLSKIRLFLLFLGTIPPCYGQISLNEIISKNNNSLIINDKSPDWIELYNDAATAINLNGFHLSDDKKELDKWTFSDIVIGAKSFLIILADGQDMLVEYAHTNFKISGSGETIILSNADVEIIESVDVPILETDISYAKIDGIWDFALPTPGLPNSTDDLIPKLSVPHFNFSSGLYEDSVLLKIFHEDEEVNISYYHNNLAKSILHKNATLDLRIKSSAVICAEVSKAGARSSDIFCNSYIFKKAHQLPVLSIISDQKAFFDEEKGMFELGPNAESDWPFWGANFWEDREEEVYFQYFNFGSDSTFYGRADLEMHGGRESRTNPQKTFRLKAKNKYEQPFFEHSFFPSKPNISTFKRLVVRNASGDFNAGHCRDGFLQDYLIKSDLDLDANAYQPIAVYINGAYYGLMGLREKIDKYYTLSNYNTTDIDLIEEELFLLEGDSNTFKMPYQYILENDLSENDKYEVATIYFDIKNLTDYFIAQIGNNSTAWPQNNIKYWREKRANAKWRYLLFDMDIALGRHFWTRAAKNSLQNKMTSFGNSNIFINTVNAFLDNESFKNYFLNRHQDLYNTLFSKKTMLPAFEIFTITIDAEMGNHLERWPTIDIGQWHNIELEKIKTFIKDRPAYSMQYFDSFFDLNGLYSISISSNISTSKFDLNSLRDLSDNFKGQYFKKIPITVAAKPIPNYYFSHWEIKNANQTTRYPFLSMTKTFTEDTELIAIYKETPLDSFVDAVFFRQNSIVLKLHTSSDENIQVDLYDLLGRSVDNSVFTFPQIGVNIFTIPFIKSVDGVLFLTVRQGDRQHTEKLVRVGF